MKAQGKVILFSGLVTCLVVFAALFLSLRQDSAFWVKLDEETSYVAFELSTVGQIAFSLLFGLFTGLCVSLFVAFTCLIRTKLRK